MKIVKIIALILLVGFVGIQFVPTDLNQSDTVPKTDFLLVNNTQENISTLLQESCYDCHSNNTEYPWYNMVQPVAWFLKDHINEGKEELNFNEWDAYSNRRKNSKLKSIISQVKDDEMPLASYTLIHKDAKLSNSEKTLIIDYMKNLKEKLK
ncbi:heme-binding domain-containing protein [Tenacibaculum sp. 1_MG-2023]|uniref:heme-binding domain-containing protein n=1 Tax=Tenacibaculum sp. 1_MG-2023 TaxID=3062653 RepID=UPI0026E1EE7F|nr:heme-binding domain-containing protein [Tenacibaculum sp. 1_MG-2023]MDO6675183.1 heme-binding domain-containing protein [Tenacibaculum sp. 1_MG-2023]